MNEQHDNFAALEAEQFIRLSTYRRSGEPVHTAVWFAYHAGRLYVQTMLGAGKIKRIRNSSAVTLAASDRSGNPTGPEVAGYARVLDEVEQRMAEEIIQHKYGEQRTQLMARMGGGEMLKRDYIEIAPAGE